MKILSIDPGYERLGIAVIEKTPRQSSSPEGSRLSRAGHRNDGKEKVLYSDCFKTSSKLIFPERLLLIGKEIRKIIKKYKPEVLAIETIFFNSNQKTAMQVAEVRGVVTYEALSAGLKLYEYTPLQIKIAVTGYGRGDKKQIISMIERLVVIDKKIAHDDEYDAIAVGLTYFASTRLI